MDPLTEGELFFELLKRTSRTFAVCIPMLSSPLREQVALAYLLFRIADTFEDSDTIEAAARIAALGEFIEWIGEERPSARTEAAIARWSAAPPTTNDDYVFLFHNLKYVFNLYDNLPGDAKGILAADLRRSAEGMIRFLEASKGRPFALKIEALQGLRDYCYAVAGIVGELLTRLFSRQEKLPGDLTEELIAKSRYFGEYLQLTNIIKDRVEDEFEGRSFVNIDGPTQEVIDILGADRAVAGEYVEAMRGAAADRTIIRFLYFPLHLADETIRGTLEHGPGYKVTRERVREMVAALEGIA